jgi:hypothetical protein
MTVSVSQPTSSFLLTQTRQNVIQLAQDDPVVLADAAGWAYLDLRHSARVSVDLSSFRRLSGANSALPARRSNRLPSCRAHWSRWWSDLDRRSQVPFSNRLCGLLDLAISPRWRSTFVVAIRQSGWRDEMQAAFPKGEQT